MRHSLVLALALLIVDPIRAGSSPTPALQRGGNPCEWEAMFRAGTVGCEPLGPTRGTVLYADGKHPYARARVQGAIWKGKSFHGDGTFTNRWVGGIRAGSTGIRLEPSWLDGQPCFVMQYPPDALVFRNVRDEIREVAPGVWLGRSYDCVSGKAKNWFLLQCK